ncbi:sulfurtransferase complex subunit TusB [Proteobacteria bacterium 005FR1]|nr:sulfurtransferase complex subunit TusB [Proteobacteria bacterium 005FR1]
MLHTVNKSAFTSPLLSRCIDSAATGDDILLLNDGIYGASSSSPCAASLEALIRDGGCRVFALQEDAERRSLTGALLAGVQLIGIAEFVKLAEKHPASQSWY